MTRYAESTTVSSDTSRAEIERLTAALRKAQFFISCSLPIVKEGDISGEGVEIGGEVLAAIDDLIGPYQTGMLAREALAGKETTT